MQFCVEPSFPAMPVTSLLEDGSRFLFPIHSTSVTLWISVFRSCHIFFITVRSEIWLNLFFFFFFSSFSLQGSPQKVICLHLLMSSASSTLTLTNFLSSFITSINLCFGLCHVLLPCGSNLSILIRFDNFLSSEHVQTIPTWLCWTMSTSVAPLTYSLLILIHEGTGVLRDTVAI